MSYAEIAASMNALQKTLDELTAPYIPPPEEVELLTAALAKLIAAYKRRDFAPGEEAVWNCGSITIDGKDEGAWEIHLTPTAAPTPDRIPKGRDREAGRGAKP